MHKWESKDQKTAYYIWAYRGSIARVVEMTGLSIEQAESYFRMFEDWNNEV